MALSIGSWRVFGLGQTVATSKRSTLLLRLPAWATGTPTSSKNWPTCSAREQRPLIRPLEPWDGGFCHWRTSSQILVGIQSAQAPTRCGRGPSSEFGSGAKRERPRTRTERGWTRYARGKEANKGWCLRRHNRGDQL